MLQKLEFYKVFLINFPLKYESNFSLLKTFSIVSFFSHTFITTELFFFVRSEFSMRIVQQMAILAVI